MTRLSCHRFRSNEVRLWLSVIAYNLGNLWRRLALPQRIENWSLTSLQQRLVKTGGRLVKHGSLLLAAAGGEPADVAPVRRHASAHGGFAAASRIGLAVRRNQSGCWGLTKKCPRKRFGMGQIIAFGFRQMPCGARPGLWLWNQCKKDCERMQTGINWFAAERQNGNFRQEGFTHENKSISSLGCSRGAVW